VYSGFVGCVERARHCAVVATNCVVRHMSYGKLLLLNYQVKSNFINTKKAFKKLYMFYFETFRIILNPFSVKKYI